MLRLLHDLGLSWQKARPVHPEADRKAINEYQQNAFEFDARHTALEQEKFLFLAEAGPYAEADDKRALLLQRVANPLLLDANGLERRRSKHDREYRMAA